jgi:hypothetical protein
LCRAVRTFIDVLADRVSANATHAIVILTTAFTGGALRITVATTIEGSFVSVLNTIIAGSDLAQ